MKCQKPELSEQDKDRAKLIYKYLKKVEKPVTKEQLCTVIGWEYNKSNERKIRDIISIIAERKPIISTSDSVGYRLALQLKDLEDAMHQRAELHSRASNILKRVVPLDDFIDRAEALKNKENIYE